MSVDPLAGEYAAWTPYHYVHNNPVRLTDPTGMSADTIKVGKEDQEFVLNRIHEKTDARYTFNENDEMVRGNQISDAYSDKIDAAIESENEMTIKHGEMVDRSGIGIDIMFAAGGGQTASRIKFNGYDKNGKVQLKEYTEITISKRGNEKIFDKSGNKLSYSSGDILLHEIVGHGLPMMGIKGSGNAIKNENVVRKSLGLKERKKDKSHYE